MAACILGAAGALVLERLILRVSCTIMKKFCGQLWTAQPHPGWTPPTPLPPPFKNSESSENWHDIDPETTSPEALYPLVISSIVPRPIAFVSTIGPDGKTGNLAPFSYFNTVGHAPPLVAIGFATTKLRDHGLKDTLYNILETGEFVVNIISEWYVEAANHCCGNFPYGSNEMELSGLHPQPSHKIKPPRVAEAGVQLECVLRQKYQAFKQSGGKADNADEKPTTTVIIGEVVMFHIADGVSGKSPSGKLIVDINKFAPISRLGGNTYGRTSGLFDLPRPDR